MCQILFIKILYMNNFEKQNSWVYLYRRNTCMRVVSHRKLKEFYGQRGREDAKPALERWYQIAENARWRSFTDIKKDFSSVDSVGNQRYVFNIKGNDYRLVVVTKFLMGYVFIRFVGTHSEYDKIDVKTI